MGWVLKLKLVKEWRILHKLWSSKLYIIGVIVLAFGDAAQHILFAWGVLPNELKSTIPEDWVTGVSIFIFTASFLSRYIREKQHHRDAEKER